MAKKSTKPKKKHCKTCDNNIIESEDRGELRYTDTYHQLSTKKYCDEHEQKYTNHKCKPHWCGDCGFLIDYCIEIVKT